MNGSELKGALAPEGMLAEQRCTLPGAPFMRAPLAHEWAATNARGIGHKSRVVPPSTEAQKYLLRKHPKIRMSSPLRPRADFNPLTPNNLPLQK
jgi:hypothetical protein